MAIAKGNISSEGQSYKRYIGIAPVFIKAVNPDKALHEKLFNTQLEEAPNYLSSIEVDGYNVPNARILVVLQPDTDKIGFDMPLITMSLFIQNRARVGAATGKTQIIDKYGRTAWASPEELKAHAIPMYSNGPADIDKDYRPAYIGEQELVDFVKAYLCIPNVTIWDNNSKKRIPNPKFTPEECECRFDKLNKLFEGDFSEIRDALDFQPTNKVKVLLGVRTDAESGRLYQTVYTRKFLSNAATNYSSMEQEIQNMINSANASGRSLNTEYEVVPVHEYSVEPTKFTAPNSSSPADDLPFSSSSDSNTSPWE